MNIDKPNFDWSDINTVSSPSMWCKYLIDKVGRKLQLPTFKDEASSLNNHDMRTILDFLHHQDWKSEVGAFTKNVIADRVNDRHLCIYSFPYMFNSKTDETLDLDLFFKPGEVFYHLKYCVAWFGQNLMGCFKERDVAFLEMLKGSNIKFVDYKFNTDASKRGEFIEVWLEFKQDVNSCYFDINQKKVKEELEVIFKFAVKVRWKANLIDNVAEIRRLANINLDIGGCTVTVNDKKLPKDNDTIMSFGFDFSSEKSSIEYSLRYEWPMKAVDNRSSVNRTIAFLEVSDFFSCLSRQGAYFESSYKSYVYVRIDSYRTLKYSIDIEGFVKNACEKSMEEAEKMLESIDDAYEEKETIRRNIKRHFKKKSKERIDKIMNIVEP